MKLQGNKILIKISNKDRDKTEQVSVVKKDGSISNIILSLPAYQNVHQYEYSVRHGVVIAVSENVTHVEVGDYVIFMPQIDYDPKYLVSQEADGKIVWADATTTFHTEDRVVYGYGGRDGMERRERRQLVWADGDIDELSLIVAIVRGEQITPNIPYIFCEPEETAKRIDLSNLLNSSGEVIDSSELTLSSGGLWIPPADPTDFSSKEVLRRTIIASSDPSLSPGITVLVKEESEFVYNIFGNKLCVIYSMDVLAELE